MSKKNYIFINWGQSWPNGQTNTMVDLPSDYANKYLLNTRIWGGTDFEALYSPDNNNQFPISVRSNAANVAFLYKDIADLYGDIYILHIAQGSTRIQLDASRVDWNIASSSELYDTMIAEIISVKAWMVARGKDYEFRSSYEGHGEGDSVVESASTEYQANLQAFRDAVETEIGYAIKWYNYNVVTPPSGNRPYKDNVNAAKATVLAANPSSGTLFNTPITEWNPDNIHPTFAQTQSIIWDDNLKTLIRADLNI